MREESIEHLRHGADDGHLESMYLLAACLAQGRNCDKDEREAAKWFHAASKKGHAKAKTSLGYLYATGKGVRRDLVLAYVMISQASHLGDVQAGDLLERLRKNMSAPQIKDAERRLRNSTV